MFSFQVILNVQKSCKNNAESSLPFLQLCWMLASHIAIACGSKWRIHVCALQWTKLPHLFVIVLFLPDFLCFPADVLFSLLGSCIAFTCHVFSFSFNWWQFLNPSLFSWLTFSKSTQCLSDVSSLMDWILGGKNKKDHKGYIPFSSHHTRGPLISTLFIFDSVDLDHLPGLSTLKLLFPPIHSKRAHTQGEKN